MNKLIEMFDDLNKKVYDFGYWDGNDQWNYSLNGLYMACDNKGRAQTLILGIACEEALNEEDIDTKDLFELAEHVHWNEEYGFIDLDGITIEIEIGNNFHGVDELVDWALGLDGQYNFRHGDEYQNFFWIKLHWSDWAS